MFGIPDVLGIKTAAIAGGVALVVGLAAGGYAGYRWEHGALVDLQLADAKAMTQAVTDALAKQKRIDGLNQADAVDAAYFRGKADATTITLKLGAPANVTILQDQQAAASDHAGCITYGFYRLLIAGERLQTPDSFSLPGGESVDTCTAVEPSELAAEVAQDLAAGSVNGHQLDSLIGAVKRNDAIVAAPAP